VKAALAAEHPWLRELWRSGGEPDPARVQELTGEPGDVVLMHARTLHAPAPNAAAAPRMMLVEIINRRRSVEAG
jgi:ectoine hydroxylase-related dioxygenase (phytanoyl-CoA dioxygenase family)